MKGKAVIFSAPSGSGKTTIVHGLLERIPLLSFSISATTRSKRPNEVDGKDYYFLSLSDFRNKISQGELIEWEEVYEDTFYGTLKEEVERIWSKGKHVVFDVDVKGGLNLKRNFGDRAISIFVKVPSIEILRDRLKLRRTENEKTLRMRIEKASEEMLQEENFDEVVVNENLNETFSKAKKIVEAFIQQ